MAPEVDDLHDHRTVQSERRFNHLDGESFWEETQRWYQRHYPFSRRTAYVSGCDGTGKPENPDLFRTDDHQLGHRRIYGTLPDLKSRKWQLEQQVRFPAGSGRCWPFARAPMYRLKSRDSSGQNRRWDLLRKGVRQMFEIH